LGDQDKATTTDRQLADGAGGQTYRYKLGVTMITKEQQAAIAAKVNSMTLPRGMGTEVI
jgi:hypothetical protein